MREFLKYVFLVLLGTGLLYLSFSFIEMSFNPKVWSYWSRTIMTVLWLGNFYFSAYITSKL